MFLRLKNVLDYEVLENDINKMVMNSVVCARIKEVLQITDEAYGTDRTSKDMGGYVYLFSTQSTYDANIRKMLELNHVEPDMYEFSDTLSNENGILWMEELYLISSDDAITVFHPVNGGVTNE